MADYAASLRTTNSPNLDTPPSWAPPPRWDSPPNWTEMAWVAGSPSETPRWTSKNAIQLGGVGWVDIEPLNSEHNSE